jgi:hypothetical protein
MRALIISALLLLSASAAWAAGPFRFYSVAPCRIVDTRGANSATGGPALQGASVRSFPINGRCGVPSSARAAVLNVTIVAPSTSGHLRIWPYGTTMPNVSTINFGAGEPAIANGAVVPLTTGSSLNISTYLGTGSGATAHLLIDVTGYFQ